MIRGRESTRHLVVMAVVGLVAWGTVLWASLWPSGLELKPLETSREWTACGFFAVSARFLAFRAYSRIRIAIDSAFYIVMVFICGILPAALLVMLTLSADFLVRFYTGGGLYRFGEVSLGRIWTLAMYNGGLPALILLGLGKLFGETSLMDADVMAISWMLPVYALSFLGVHYLIIGIRQRWMGVTFRVIRGFLLRSIGAELLLFPLALAMVLGYRDQGFWFFMLIGMASLLTNAVYRRQARIGDELRDRVEELSTLNEVGQVISGSLQKDTLVKNIATATLHLVGHTSCFMLGLVDETTRQLKCRFFDAEGEEFLTAEIAPSEGLSGWIIANRSPLLLSELQREYRDYVVDETHNDPDFHCWLGVPLMAYDEVVGVMTVQSEEHGVFTQDHLRVLTTIADQAAVALENSRLYGLATVDGLTGLFVRRYFDYRLEEEWERSSRFETPFVVALFDLDNFKAINDTYGHGVGDRVLRAFGAVILNNMRSIDIAARYGGEEFAFILPRTELYEAQAVAERIRADIEAEPVNTDSGVLTVTVSIGLAGFPDAEIPNISRLLEGADEALYRAKRGGKNRIECFRPPSGSA